MEGNLQRLFDDILIKILLEGHNESLIGLASLIVAVSMQKGEKWFIRDGYGDYLSGFLISTL